VKKLLVLLILVAGVVAFLYYPRGVAASGTDVATLAILNTAIEGSRAGAGFAQALDGELYKSGDLVRANVDGRAVLTFFDGSSLSVDPGSQVKVVSLTRVPAEGIQVTIEQTLGRSWSAVQKLKTPDSRYEVKTPSTTAVVRGTAFLTLVQQVPSGATQTTYQVDDGTLQVTAVAGGTVSVPAGMQVTIAEGAQAPAAATPIPAAPRLEISTTPGLSFLVISPSGAACGPIGTKAEIFGCVATADKITVREPVPGRWGLFLKSTAAGSPTLSVALGGGGTRNAERAVSKAVNANDQLRSGFTLTGTPVNMSALEEAAPVTSMCAALAPGRVFASGDAGTRFETVRTFSATNKGAPVSVVFTEAELNQAIASSPASANQGVTISDAKVKIDQGGMHVAARATTQILTVNATADVVGGPVADKFSLRVTHITADPLPPGLLDFVKGFADTSAAAIEATPFLVRQVAFRAGCFFVAGVTPK
jgi:hypothetical protein